MKKTLNLFRRILTIFGAGCFVIIIFLLITGIGYKSAVQETKLADIKITPKGAQEFIADITFTNNTKSNRYHIKGDQFYIDAKIIKWNKWVGYIGLKTWYQFDRVGGRYIDLNDEMNKPRTIFKLHSNNELDLFELRRNYSVLSILLQSEYGSAFYVPADKQKRFDLLLSRTGLTLNEVEFNNNPLRINVNN